MKKMKEANIMQVFGKNRMEWKLTRKMTQKKNKAKERNKLNHLYRMTTKVYYKIIEIMNKMEVSQIRIISKRKRRKKKNKLL